MNNLTSLFLSQSYQDTWEDYNRSLSSENFPKWDYIILTASMKIRPWDIAVRLSPEEMFCLRKRILL